MCAARPSSQASEDLTSACTEQESTSSSSARPTPGGEKSSPDTGRESRASRMSEKSTREPSLKKSQPLKKLTQLQVSESIALYESGLSLAKVAARMGVSRQSMHDLLKRRIVLRGRIEALPRVEDRTKLQEKRRRALKRYRSRAARITNAQIREVKARDKVCVTCGEPGEDVDHIVPVRAGGQTTLSNLQLLCEDCHIEKSRQDWKTYPRETYREEVS